MKKDDTNIDPILAGVTSEKFIQKTQPFVELMMYYRCAIKEISTKFEVLSEEFSINHQRNPVETIKTRIKEPSSILVKLSRKELCMSVENIEENIYDVAGIRVICSFVDDIYSLCDMFTSQDDISVIEIRDYIKEPKDSGYRSLHVIVEVPIFLSGEKKYVKAEVQFRTIAMDFWASLEHKLKYKKDIKNANIISRELHDVAASIEVLDRRMQNIRERIERGEEE